jgi:endonuclease/exonuclease/phosphatase family metal-dependent hydrolase
MKLVKIIAGFLVILAGIIIGFLLFLTIMDYYPADKETIRVEGKGATIPQSLKYFTFLTWNIGYAGLGQNMDFFYEGGKRVRPMKDEFNGYLKGICNCLSSADSIDFVFIQEIDVHSKRSYFTDEIAEISKSLPGKCSLFAKNYDSRYIPVPFNDPMGRVVSGIVTFTKFKPMSAERIDYGTRFSWPKQLALLKRCFMIMRYNLNNGKDLVVINLHNSTFDKGGKLRIKELKILQSYALTEYSQGNFVVVGGDWNNNPRGFNPGSIISGDAAKLIEPALDSTFLPGWKFAFDSLAPSNRDVDMYYKKTKTKTTIIDFYVVSPNIEVLLTQTIATGFKFSDHQPVVMKIALK